MPDLPGHGNLVSVLRSASSGFRQGHLLIGSDVLPVVALHTLTTIEDNMRITESQLRKIVREEYR
jgi:hypothetical protein